MNGNHILGVILLVFGLVWLFFGEKQIKESGKEGIVYRLFFQKRSQFSIKLLRWVGGLGLTYVGLAFLLGWIK